MPQADVIPPFLCENPLIFEQGNPLYQKTPPPLLEMLSVLLASSLGCWKPFCADMLMHCMSHFMSTVKLKAGTET